MHELHELVDEERLGLYGSNALGGDPTGSPALPWDSSFSKSSPTEVLRVTGAWAGQVLQIAAAREVLRIGWMSTDAWHAGAAWRSNGAWQAGYRCRGLYGAWGRRR